MNLTAHQISLLVIAAKNDLRARFERRHCWSQPIPSLNMPSRPEYAVQQREDIRDLIAALRALDKEHKRQWQRESLTAAA